MAQDDSETEAVLRDIQKTYITANVPIGDNFNKFLIRDAERYLSAREHKKLKATYELLRNAPTQSGVGYPHFYVWVQGRDSSRKLIAEGAMRLQAMDKKKFEISDYLPKAEIVQRPESVARVFPGLLVGKIHEKAKK